MPRFSLTLPQPLHEQLKIISSNNEQTLSTTTTKMIELGLQEYKNTSPEKTVTPPSEVEIHCQKLIIQMNALLKNLTAKTIEYGNDEFENVQKYAIKKYNMLAGIEPEEL